MPGLSYFNIFDEDLPFTPPLETKDTLYDQAMRFVLRWEGGYSNHPNDPGGETNFGVTHAVYDAWRIEQNLPKRSVKEIEEHEVFAIYKNKYWLKSECLKLTPYEELALMHFDTAINMGLRRAAKTLQEAVGVTADGIIGDITLGAVHHKCQISALETMTAYADIRERVYRWIATNRDGSEKFLKGWMNRLNDIRQEVGIDVSTETNIPELAIDYPMGHLLDIDPDADLEGL